MSRRIACCTAALVCAVGLSGAQAAELARAIPVAGNAWHLELADVTGEGEAEIVYACYDGKVCCQDAASSAPLWQHETHAFPYDLATGDLDGDGRAEAFVASSDGGLYAISPDGKLLWRHETRATLYQVAIASMAGESWVATGGVDRNLYLLNGRGEIVKSVQHERVIRLLAAGDLDGDGEDEIVFTSHGGEIWAYRGPGLEELWRSRIYPIVEGEPTRGWWRAYSLSLADLDGDGRCEMLYGAGFYNQNGIRVLNSDGTLLWDKPEGFYFRDSTHYSHTAVVALDVAPTPGAEVLALNARRLFVFDREGNELAAGVSPVSFTDISARTTTDGQPEVWLASSPNGEDRIYRVSLAEGWPDDLAALKWEGKMARVTENLRRIRQQVAEYEGSAPEGARYVHVVSGGQPNTPEKIRGHFGVIDFYREQFPYDCLTFAMSINVASIEGVPGFSNPDRRTEASRLPPEEIAPLLKGTCEEAGVPFLAVVGHGCEPQITLETAEAVLEACPQTCLGFSCSENSTYEDRLAHFLEDYWYGLMDLCARYGKKAIMVEKGAFWATIPAMARYRKLVDGTYAEVLVPSVEDSNSRSPELNLAGRAGLFMAGAVKTWSARTIADELCWNRYWEWEFPMTGHPFLRRHLAQAALGATIFESHISRHQHAWQVEDRDEDTPDIALTDMGEQTIGIIAHMLGKGLLIPPRREDILGASPCVISMREPQEAFLLEAANFHRHREFEWSEQEAASPFEGLACHWGAAPVREHYLGAYLMEQDRHYGTFVPATPFGFPLIVPTFLQGRLARQPAWTLETDGSFLYDEGRAVSGVEGREPVLGRFREAAEQLDFRAEGHVFMQAQRLDANTVRLTLIDPGFLDPDDREATLHVKPGVRELVDLLSGEKLEVREGLARLSVPAGAFRVLEARL